MSSNDHIDIIKENLNCHHILFIKDVKLADYKPQEDCFKLAHVNVSIKKARLNGVVVAKKEVEGCHHFWLDDGTSVIVAIISNLILNRRNGYSIELGTNITVFGDIIYQNNENMLQCGGFKIEEDCTLEIYHWLKVLQDRPTRDDAPATNMFYSLSSYPSPNRLLDANFMQSPVEDIDARNATYLWSPNHKFATSTPIRLHQQHPITNSPLRAMTEERVNNDDDEFDDDDEFGDIDFSLIESNAMHQLSNNKRKRSLSK